MGCFSSANTNAKLVKSNIVHQNSFLKFKSGSDPSALKNLKTKETLIKIRTNQLIKEGEKGIEDNYRILEKIGSGGFGEVYKVLHLRSGMIRAMKVVKKDDSNADSPKIYKDNTSGVRNFIKEISLLIEIDHPNVIKIFEYFIDEKHFYIITEYLAGGALYDTIIKQRFVQEKTAALFIYQILSAVNYLNSKKIVHRDLKPENILITKDMNLKLIDFGMGNFMNSTQKMNKRVGTSYYIAPEVINKEYDEKCDIWSCGAILHAMLVGYPPFMGNTNQEIMEKVLEGKKNFFAQPEWEKISPLAKDLLSKMLTYDSQARISAQEALTHPWIIGSHAREELYDEEFAKTVIQNIKNFNAKEKLQQATIAYIVHFNFSTEDMTELTKVFKSFDKNADGKLSLSEFQEGYRKHYGQLLSDLQMKSIFENVDLDNNGYLEYEEFLRASINQKNILAETNLKMAFEQFDINKDGTLSLEEIKSILGTRDSKYIEQLILKIDKNKDGVVSFSEFCDMMKEIVLDESK